MTNESRSPEEIERQIELERAGLTSTLNDLQDRFSVDSIARQLTDQFRENGGEIGRNMVDAVKTNPIAVALTGIGIAWLLMGDKTPQRMVDYDADLDDRRAQARLPRRETVTPIYADRARTSGTRPAPVPYWARHEDDDDDESWSDRASDAADSARSTVADTVNRASNTGHDMADRMAARAQTMRKRLSHGTESLADDARERVIDARARASDARDSALEYVREGRDKASDMFQDHPLIAGALAVAVGAAIAAALPRSDLEDAYMGDESDALMDDAERMYEEEMANLSRAATAAKEEAKDSLHDLKDEAKASATRVADAAKAEVTPETTAGTIPQEMSARSDTANKS